MPKTAHALIDDAEEVPVSSNEVLEAHVAAIRAELTELKSDFRASVARNDEHFRTLHADCNSLRDKIDQNYVSLDAKISGCLTSLDGRINATYLSLDQKISGFHAALDEKYARLDRKIDASHASLDQKISSLSAALDEKYVSLDRKIDTSHASLDRKIDTSHASLDRKIDTSHASLDQKIDRISGELRTEMNDMRVRFSALTADMADLRSMQKAILWVLGGTGTLIAAVGVGIAKTLHWL